MACGTGLTRSSARIDSKSHPPAPPIRSQIKNTGLVCNDAPSSFSRELETASVTNMVRITLTLLLCVVAGYPGRPVAAAHLAEPALDALRVALSFDEPCAVKRSLAESDLSEFTEKEALWASPAALADAFILESLVGMRRPLRNANFAPTTAVYIAGGLAALVLALVVMFGVRLGTLKIEEFWALFLLK